MIAISSLTDLTALTLTLFLIALARFPNSQVEIVSSRLKGCGEQAISNVVLEFPPKDSCKRRVNFDYLYGICPFPPPSASILMHCPSDVRDWLILLASTRRYPSTAVLEVFSEPAKSTKHSLPSFLDSSFWFFWPTVMMMMVCERDETAFMLVAETARF